MSFSKLGFAATTSAMVLLLCLKSTSFGQGYGIELHNNAMPASAGMAGTSLSRPQDNLSAINGNPATLTQYSGTTTTFGGAFIEPTVNIQQSVNVPLLGVTPYSGKSDFPASLLANIGVTHELEMMGTPVNMGVGFIANAGLGSDYRPFPNSNGTQGNYMALDLVTSAAVRLTDRLSVGGSFQLGTGIIDGPFVQIGGSQLDYAPRFSLGTNYELGNGVSVGGYWQSKKNHTFENAVFLPGPGAYFDMALDHPSNFGLGIANRCLMNGRLLLAVDVIFKDWSDTDFFGSIYQDQWAFSFGGQYLVNQRTKFRFGYAYNEDPTRDMVPGNIGGVPIGNIPAIQYVQGQFAAINQHRLAGGLGITEMLPGIDFDISVGGAFQADKSFGATTSSVECYFFAFGFTFRRGPNNPDDYGCDAYTSAEPTEYLPVNAN